MVRTGILLVIGGIAALAAPMFAGSAAMSIIGWIMLVSGIVEFVQFLTSGDAEERTGSLVGGVMTGFVGFVTIRNPAATGDGMLVLVGWFLMGGGLIRAASSIKSRPPQWGWHLASGIIDVGLGVLLWNAVVQQSVGTIGILLGIALIFRGVPRIMAGLAVRKLQTA
jgi:uncharacterized membrane protein HdeD (DUF308 family)